MSLHKAFKTDTNKESEGVEIVLTEAENKDGTFPTFVVARTGGANKRYTKAIEVATRPFRRQIELGTMQNDKAETIYREVYIETVLKSWKNVKDENENDIPFNKENARKLLTELPELYERLQAESKDIANFRDAALENEAKN